MEIDQDLKQRLVGAVVITCLAAIFVPMLFDDPIDKTGKMISELKIPDAPIKSVENKSRRLPGGSNDVLNQPEPRLFKQIATRQQSIKADLHKWFIQVGIFAKKNNATELQTKLRKAGYAVSINKVASANGLLYRVRVGPEINKQRAEKLKVKLKASYKINGIMTSVDE